MTTEEQTEFERLERRVCLMEEWAREVAELLWEVTGQIIEAPEPEEEEDARYPGH